MRTTGPPFARVARDAPSPATLKAETHRFAPVPARAIGDLRLSARHLRVLAAVAIHDRFGRNGQGCWAGRKRLADEVQCSESHLSDALGDLRLFGYINSERHPMNRRTMVHRVVYNSDDTSRIRDLSRTQAEHVPQPSAKPLQTFRDGTSNILGEASIKNSVETSHPIKTEQQVAGVENYLNEVEAVLADLSIAASARCEHAALSRIVEDASLPELIRSRAARLRIATEAVG
jgi:hypothetical protein